MGVYLLFGKPRTGKTTILTKFAVDALHGKSLKVGTLSRHTIGEFAPYDRVYCNFPVSGTYELDFDKLGIEEFRNCLILVDEIMLLCDSREWKNYSKRLRDFMALHGHYKCDFVAASQGYEDCDKRIRQLALEYLYIEKKGGLTKVSPIRSGFDINGKITEGYTLAPPVACSYVRRKKYYSEFDSYAAPGLPPNTAALWQPRVEPPGLLERIKNCFSSAT